MAAPVTGVEALAVATASFLAPGVVQFAVPSIPAIQVDSPALAAAPALPVFVPSAQLARSRNRSNVESTAPEAGTLGDFLA